MKLFIILLAIAALASCNTNETGNSAAPSTSDGATANGAQTTAHDPCLNLNTATSEELTRLPAIGEIMAKKIIDYRERHGGFRRPEEIIIIEGFSERKYRAIARMICVE